MRLDPQTCRDRMTNARVAHLATVGGDLRPHVIPVTFAVGGERIFMAVDQKPKTTTDLRRLQNIADNPRVAVLCDHYHDDWRQLWWVRADGTARLGEADSRSTALGLLTAKYRQYRADPPRGPVLVVTVTAWTGWAYGDRTGSPNCPDAGKARP